MATITYEEMQTKASTLMKELVRRLREAGMDVKTNTTGDDINTINGVHVSIYTKVEHTGDRPYGREYTGGVSFLIRPTVYDRRFFGQSTLRFPQLKDGTHSWDKIIKAISKRVTEHKDENARLQTISDKRGAFNKARAELAKELGVSEYNSLMPKFSHEYGTCSFELKGLTFKKAAAISRAAKAIMEDK